MHHTKYGIKACVLNAFLWAGILIASPGQMQSDSMMIYPLLPASPTSIDTAPEVLAVDPMMVRTGLLGTKKRLRIESCELLNTQTKQIGEVDKMTKVQRFWGASSTKIIATRLAEEDAHLLLNSRNALRSEPYVTCRGWTADELSLALELGAEPHERAGSGRLRAARCMLPDTGAMTLVMAAGV